MVPCLLPNWGLTRTMDFTIELVLSIIFVHVHDIVSIISPPILCCFLNGNKIFIYGHNELRPLHPRNHFLHSIKFGMTFHSNYLCLLVPSKTRTNCWVLWRGCLTFSSSIRPTKMSPLILFVGTYGLGSISMNFQGVVHRCKEKGSGG